ncbi:MAG: hypothetical protein FD174_554 [Geobacteraceae bacterium]|nr:MAG: hypothetical protein FD174_554 [Geobacteraceae bacterium]
MVKSAFILLACSLFLSGMAHGKEDRWYNLTEDADLTYYIDRKSVLKTPDNTHIFWVKIVSRKKEYLKKEYKLSDLEYVLFNYEIDCGRGMYKTRGTIFFDKNGKQIDKQTPTYVDMSDAEPIPPESVMELAQDAVCPDSGTDDGLPAAEQ